MTRGESRCVWSVATGCGIAYRTLPNPIDLVIVHHYRSARARSAAGEFREGVMARSRGKDIGMRRLSEAVIRRLTRLHQKAGGNAADAPAEPAPMTM